MSYFGVSSTYYWRFQLSEVLAMDGIVIVNAIVNLEEAELAAGNVHDRFRTRINAFENLSETKFIKYFRLNKELTLDLIEELTPHMEQPSRASAIDIKTRVLAALRFYAIGGYQDTIGNDIYIALSQKSVSRAISEVTSAINAIKDRHITFPVGIQEQMPVMRKFSKLYNFPGVIGCIDCTHVSLVPPPSDDPVYGEHNYVNRKGFHSINVQIVCDANMKMLHVNASYPGSTSDRFIWNSCNLKRALRRKYEENAHMGCYLLGDSGYNLEPWLMITISRAEPNSPEQVYNERQMVVRSTVERCNGLLKARFRCCLKDRVLHYHPEMASKIVYACCVLHNKCVQAGLELNLDSDEDEVSSSSSSESEEDNEEEDRNVGPRRNPVLVAGEKVRARLIRKHFT